ncbi:MAG TPA: MFS transporter [Longimicrobiales bacterium]|nr:MFS transporter [Longimicrobiales bacterium]
MSERPGRVERARRAVAEFGTTAGTLGSTAGQTVMVALLPVLLDRYTDSALLIGFAIGGEGIVAMLVPYWIGAASDHLPERIADRFGRRTFFLLVTAPLMAASVAVAPFLDGFWPIAAAAFVFFLTLHGYLAPLWALMVDEVAPERHGRVQGVRGALHSLGLAFGLVAGGLLFTIWEPLPFLVAAALILATTAITFFAAPRTRTPGHEGDPADILKLWRRLKGRPAVSWMLIANSLWSAGVDGIRPYIFLFAAIVLGINVAQTSLLLVVIVAGIGIGAVVLGTLGDRYGHAKLLAVGGTVTGVSMTAGIFVRDVPGAVVLLLCAGLGAATILTLAYPLYARLIGEKGVGRDTGLYIVTMGIGRIVAPVLIGAAIDLARPMMPETRGYPVMWPIAGGLTLLGILALARAMMFARRADAATRQTTEGP